MEPKDTLCATGHSVEISILIIGCLCYIAIKLLFEVWMSLLFCATLGFVAGLLILENIKLHGI